MSKSIYTCNSEMQAILIKNGLKKYGIESVVSPGSSMGHSIDINILTGIDSNYQVIVHDKDEKQACDLLKE